MRIVIAEASTGTTPLPHETLGEHGVEVVGVARTGREAADAIDGADINALLFPAEWIDLCRNLRLSVGLAPSQPPAFVLVADDLSVPQLLRSLVYGFDGLVTASAHPADVAETLHSIVGGSRPLAGEPLAERLGLSAGLLARELVVSGVDQAHVAELVGVGLPDEEIATALGMTIQQVRNLIEALLHANGLTYRTQLAVMQVANWKTPDFLRRR